MVGDMLDRFVIGVVLLLILLLVKLVRDERRMR
jgi:hypothetical protein